MGDSNFQHLNFWKIWIFGKVTFKSPIVRHYTLLSPTKRNGVLFYKERAIVLFASRYNEILPSGNTWASRN